MSPAHADDSVDALLTRTRAWEPPSGFALHVAAEARRATPSATAHAAFARRERLWLSGWSTDAVVASVAGRIESIRWVTRQYVSLWF
jgi:hypothetical protein